MFPNELAQVYYTDPINKRNSKNKKSVIARGKLVDKYRNKLSFLRKAKVLTSRNSDGESDDYDQDIEETNSELTGNIYYIFF